MDNSQFRNLLNEDKKKTGATHAASSSQPFKTPMLGSRARSSIPMTPRSVAGYNSANDFARQVAEQKRLANGEPPMKKFRSSAAPKGTKLKQGYQDRTILRRAAEDQEESQDDKEKRLKALEEMFKLQQIDQATFDKLKAAIGVGGDVSSTHLVKGLDWKLLERVKKGEDIEKTNEEDEKEDGPTSDIEDELDTVLEKEISSRDSAMQEDEKGETPTPASGPSQVLSRDEILRRLKAGRTTISMPPPPPVEPALGDRFKKVGSDSKAEKKRFVETINGRRREVLLTTDKRGNTKRKVRWLEKEPGREDAAPSNAEQQPLGMEVPAEIAAKQKAMLQQQQGEEDDDDDIFQGVGAEYNPLAGIGDNSDSDSGSEGEIEMKKTTQTETLEAVEASSPKARRNYFGTVGESDESKDAGSLSNDSTIMAALKKAATLRQSQDKDEGDGTTRDRDADRDVLADNDDPEKLLRQKQILEKLKQRDLDDSRDLDMGFGESRFGDEDDEDGPLWEDGDGEKKSGGRKRGPKKRKGNKDSVGDVMSVIEGRKKADA